MTSKSPGKRIYYVIFFGLLLLAFMWGVGRAIPGYFNKKVPPVTTVGSFSFTNQYGQNFSDKDLRGKVGVVNCFFTTCNTVCPIMNSNLKPVYDKYGKDPRFVMISMTSDPERDSVSRMKQYADSIHAGPSWNFLTGRKDSLYYTARMSFRIDDPKNFVTNINDDFLHTQFVALVNKKGEVVQIYDGLKPSEIRELSDRVERLLAED